MGEENNENMVTVQLDENGFIPGTSYKSVDDFVKGHSELKGRFDAQGNELGALRKFAETAEPIVKEAREKKSAPVKTDTPDYDAEIASVESELEKLDPMSDNYSSKHKELISKLTKLTAKAQHEKTLGASAELLKKELTERDAKAAQDAFIGANPSFGTPEMQVRIKDFLAKDKTGMHDPMSAFFQLQRDDLAAENQRIAAENAELQKVLDLQKGKDATGKVIVKGQSTSQVTKHQKVTGKDLDTGMADVLAKMRS